MKLNGIKKAKFKLHFQGMETVRGFNVIATLVLFVGFILSIVSIFKKQFVSPNASGWAFSAAAVFTSLFFPAL